jgi:hypothetical protein
MSDLALEEAILDTQLRHINFFNGRLLTGGDLETEQSTQHTHSRHLGMALGAGVAFGLEVAVTTDSLPSEPTLLVTKGLAVNRAGQTLRLECDQRVALLRTPDPIAADACIFSDCGPKSAGDSLASATGFYVLLIAPASQLDGKAPVSGLGNGVALCNSLYLAEGVKFRLLKLNVSPGTDANKVRNLVAYQCFGVPGLTSNDLVQNALTQTPVPNYGVEALVPTGYLTTSDVPLAIIEWTTTGLGFVDQWSVRRRISNPASGSLWEPLVGNRRLAEGEAMFLQFQEQIEGLRASGVTLSTFRAKDSFRYLPPAGIIPVANSGSPSGFNYQKFFDGLTVRGPCFIEGAQVAHLIRTSFNYPANDSDTGVTIWLYQVRENEQGIEEGTLAQPQAYVIFVSGYIPPQVVARFDVARWSYSNYTIR